MPIHSELPVRPGDDWWIATIVNRNDGYIVDELLSMQGPMLFLSLRGRRLDMTCDESEVLIVLDDNTALELIEDLQEFRRMLDYPQETT